MGGLWGSDQTGTKKQILEVIFMSKCIVVDYFSCWWKVFLLEIFDISFELRFTTFSQKKISKISRKWITLTATKLVTLLNLGYLLILVVSGNHKLVSLFIIFCRQLAETKNVVFQAHEYARVTLHYSEWQIFQVPSKRRNQIQVETLAKKWALIYWTLVKNQTQCFFWVQNRPNILLCVLYLTFLL